MSTTALDETDELYKLLANSWTEREHEKVRGDSQWTREYLARLTSLPLDELVREPAELRAEKAKLEQDAQQLAFEDYPALIHAQTCRQQVHTALDDLDAHLDGFLETVPELQQACDAFAKMAETLATERRKVIRVMEYHNTLTDLLEIPQLMETCVWNGYFSEAMDLASHVRLLLVKYPLPIVRNIHDQVQASADLMLAQLISHLKRPIKLAAAMNVIGHLRRMDVFESENELRVVFLSCRHKYLSQRLERLKPTDETFSRQAAFDYLKRYIDVMREQMFEIATHYMSVFSHQDQNSILILSDYMTQIVGDIKKTLETYLKQIHDTSALASLLTQIQYCGMSLGRIGLDFRHLFVQAFEDTMRPLILKRIDDATSELVQNLSTNDKPSMRMSASKLGLHQDSAQTQPNQPPMLLVDYPPIAIFTNNILTAFNALRLLPAVSLLKPVSRHLDACFLEIASALRQYADQMTEKYPEEASTVQSFTAAYVRCCVPFLKGCLLDGLYGSVPQAAQDANVEQDDLEALLGAYLPKIEQEGK